MCVCVYITKIVCSVNAEVQSSHLVELIVGANTILHWVSNRQGRAYRLYSVGAYTILHWPPSLEVNF